MNPLSLTLIGFDPLETGSGIKTIAITYNKVMQVILGTNGCGKSKIFEETSPLPAINRYYKPNGSKVFTCEHEGNEYRITTKFDDKGKASHSLYNLTTNLEMNPGGTVTVQKELVERLFGYTDNLHKILTGKLSYSSMSTQQRKDLLLKVSGMDLAFVLDLFDKARIAYRDALGAYKHVKGRVEQLGTEVVSEDVLNATLKRKDEILKQITEIRDFIESGNTNGAKKLDEVKNFLQGYFTRQTSNLRKVESALRDLGQENELTYELEAEAEGTILELEKSLAVYNNTAEELAAKAEKINAVALKLDSLDISDARENLDVRISELELEINRIDAITGELLIQPSTNMRAYLHDVSALRVGLMEIQSEYDSGLRIFTRDEAVSVQATYKAMHEEMRSTEEKIKSEEEFLRQIRLDSERNVTCSKCGHLNLGSEHSSSEHITETKQNIEKLNEQLHKLKEKADKYHADNMVPLGKMLDIIRRTSGLVEQSHHGKLLFAKLSSTGAINYSDFIKSGQVYTDRLAQEVANVELRIALKDKEEQHRSLCDYRELVSLGVMDKVSDIEKRLSDTLEKIEKAEKEKEIVERLTYGLRDMGESFGEFQNQKDAIADALVANVNEELTYHAKVKISQLTADLAIVEDVIFKASNKTAILEAASREQMELDRKRNALKNLVNAISPQTGIIGDALRNVLESFTEDVNDYISRIWGYDMETVPYASPSKLDFKMPLKVKGKQILDISEGSFGQIEIVDFAITLCIMDYLDLRDYPIFMDEVGTKFDTVHKENLLNFTGELALSGKYSKVLTISHFASLHSSGDNVDFIVVNSDNITTPPVFNQNVKITY